MKILIVDDDAHIREVVTIGLELQWQDVSVLAADNGKAALEVLAEDAPDLILLDVGLPDLNGFEVLRAIRAASDVPVIIVTARDEDMDEVRGLEFGADDYIVKPFTHPTLMARIRAVLRRAELPPPERALPDFVAGELAIHFGTRRVTLGGQPVCLTPTEHRLLPHLARHAGRVLPHQALLRAVWGPDFPATTDNLKVLVSRLRAKLERPGGPVYIETDRGIGYRLARPTAPIAPPPSPSTNGLDVPSPRHGLPTDGAGRVTGPAASRDQASSGRPPDRRPGSRAERGRQGHCRWPFDPLWCRQRRGAPRRAE